MHGPDGFALRETVLHGHRIGYRMAGPEPPERPVVLVHGMLNSSRHWREVALRLADRHTVVAPDLHGHGHSAGPQGDYSIGAHAAGIRDLLARLGIDRVSVVGHSLGGGVAMQFFYQFPERTERLALVSSGGLGREVSWPLRVAAAPGVEGLLGAATSRPVLRALALAARRAPSLRPALRALSGLETAEARRGFVWTLRSVIDVHGQRVNAHDRLYLAGAVPTLIVWGARDHTIPVAHGIAAQRAVPGSRLEILPDAAHFPHLEDPERLARVLRAFLGESAPTEPVDADAWRRLVTGRVPVRTRRRGARARPG